MNARLGAVSSQPGCLRRRLCRQQAAPPVLLLSSPQEARLPDPAAGTLASSPLQALNVHRTLLSHIIYLKPLEDREVKIKAE